MFGTSGIRGTVGEDVTAALALSLGRAVASVGDTSVVLGRDARESGVVLAEAFSAGARECGADVVDIGRASTPTVARSVGWRDADVGVSITASHNPASDNGFKFWEPTGQGVDADRRASITNAVEQADYDLAGWDRHGDRLSWGGAREAHLDALCGVLDTATDVRVVVDVGNGMGGLTADVLYERGYVVETINGQPDGRFPGRPSEPTAETCASLCRHVESTDAALGIAHDGDADRMMAVDETGAFVPGDVLLALFAREAGRGGDSIAAPVDTSMAVDDALAERGMAVARTRVGDVFVAERTTESGVVFGGEPSGAWIWPEETLCPDGPLAACKLVNLVNESGSLAELVRSIETYPIRRDVVSVADKETRMDRIREHVIDAYDDVTTVDGVRVDHGDGWTLVRASGTQPLIRLTAEARDPDRTETLLSELRTLVRDTANAN